MNISITARHGTLREDLRERVEERIQRLLRLYQKVTKIEVVFDHERAETKVEVIVHADHRHLFVVTENHRDPKVAADQALKVAEERLRRYKTKLRDWQHGQI